MLRACPGILACSFYLKVYVQIRNLLYKIGILKNFWWLHLYWKMALESHLLSLFFGTSGSNIFEIVTESGMSGFLDVQTRYWNLWFLLQLSGGCELTVVIHDFTACNSNELTIRRGQTVEVLERPHDKPDWCLVRTTDRSPAAEGLVPCGSLCIAHSRSSMEMEGIFNHKGRRLTSFFCYFFKRSTWDISDGGLIFDGFTLLRCKMSPFIHQWRGPVGFRIMLYAHVCRLPHALLGCSIGQTMKTWAKSQAPIQLPVRPE